MVGWVEVVIEVDSCLVVVPGEWAVVDQPEETCSRGQETGSVQMLDVETRTLPGGWSVTNARHLNPKDSDLHLSLLQGVTVVAVAQAACVVAVEWTAEVPGDPEASVGAEVEIVVASEEDEAWTEEDLAEEVVVGLLWMTWEGGDEEWDHLVKWI